MQRFLRWLALAFVVFFVLPIALITWAFTRSESVPAASVLHVVLDGPIPESVRPSLGAFLGGHMNVSLHSLTHSIRRAAQDERIVGLVLDIRTPTVGLAQVSELTAAMEEFKKSHKWNIAFMESAGELGHGDGAYALACSAEQIALSPPGEVNLSGLRSEVPFLKEALSRFHVQAYTEQRYEYKNFANTFNQAGFTPEHKESLKTVLDDLQETLLERVAAGRKISAPEAHRWVENAPYSAQEALKLHLVDKLWYWDEVLTEVEKIAGRKDAFMEVEAYAERPKMKNGEAVAFIVGAGQINSGESGKNPMEASDSMGSDTLSQAFRDARNDEVKAVLLRIDSPGGSYIASDVIRREVELTRKANIPVVVSMGNVAASGGYFIAADADYIVAEPGTITGSIGVLAASFALRDFLRHWIGVEVGVYETIPHDGSLQWLDPPTDGDKARLGKTLDRIYSDFVTKVAAGRHKTYEEVHAMAKGRIWSGRQAVKNGLADELGGMETALAYIRTRLKLTQDADLHLVPYPEVDNFAMVRDLIGSHVDSRIPPPLRGVTRAVQQALAPWQDTVLLAAPGLP